MKILNTKILSLMFSVMAIFALSGCGSSGTSSSDELVGGTPVAPPVVTPTPPIENATLVVDAGQDKDVAAGHEVSLHGIAKMADGSTSFEVSWTQEDGSLSVILNNADTFNPTFTSPHVHVKTLLLFNMHVKSGDWESRDVVGIFVLPTTVPQVLSPHTIVTHTGSNVAVHSTALPPAGGHALTHQWTQVSGPTVTLTTPNGPSTGFVAPVATSTTAPVVLSHTTQNTTTGTKKTVKHSVHVIPHAVTPVTLGVTVSNTADIYETLKATLHASATGGDGHYTYAWSETTGAGITLNTTDPQNPTFIAPKVGKDTVIELQLVVTDTDGHSVTKLIPLTIKNVTLTVKASTDALVHSTQTTHLHAVATETPTLNPITYHWSQQSAQHNATITNGETANPAIKLLVSPHTYSFKVEATDSAGNKATDDVNITASDDLHVSTGPDQRVNEGTTVTLSVASTGSNLGTVTYLWEDFTYGIGTKIPLTGADTPNPTFIAPLTKGTSPETFSFLLTVINSNGLRASNMVEITVLPILPTVSIVAAASMPKGSDINASCSVTGGHAPFTFAWSSVTNLTLGTPKTVSPTSTIPIHAESITTSPAILTCEVTDARGSKIPKTQPISIFPPLSFATITVPGEIKENESAHLNALAHDGTAPYTYKWTVEPADKGVIRDPAAASTTFTPNPVPSSGTAAMVCVKVTDDLNASIQQCIYMKIKDVPLSVGPIAGTTSAKSGDIISLSVKPASGGSGGPYTYQWYQNGTVISGATSLNPTITAPHVPDGKQCNHGGHNCHPIVGYKSFSYFVKVTDTKTNEHIDSHPVTVMVRSR